MDRYKAIINTHPTVVTINGDKDAWDKDGNVIVLDESKIAPEMARLQAEWVNAKPMNDWKASMQETDAGMPRYMEDLITSNASLVIPTEMKERYDAKIKIRGEKP
jgi:hypothetical protein